MCGLIFFHTEQNKPTERIPRAQQLLAHRGPDAESSVSFENQYGYFYFGHTRLSIIDRNDRSNQPFYSACGRYLLIYNGEIYNYKEIKKKYRGYQWRTDSDTEVLLIRLVTDGIQALDEFVGMFAFCLYDLHQCKIIFARDRFGIKPLYLYRKGSLTVICSEILPITELTRHKEPNKSTIYKYLMNGECDSGPETFYEDIYCVEAGTAGSVDFISQKFKLSRWYDVNKVRKDDLTGLSEAEIMAGLETRLDSAIETASISDVPIAYNVSGGVDSAFLISNLQKRNEGGALFIQTYPPPYNEYSVLSEIAGPLKIHEISSNASQIWSEIDDCLVSQGEPFGSAFICGYSRLYAEGARQGYKVFMDGNGIDEILLGYTKYQKLARLFSEKGVNNNPKRKVALDVGVSIDGTTGIRNIISDALKDSVGDLFSQKHQITSVREAAILDLTRYKIPRGLRFNDRVSMMHSIELRVPFLDHRLVEYAICIPEKYLLNNNSTKTLFRRILAKRIKGNVTVNRAKQSVQLPQREWFKNDWRNGVLEILEDKRTKSRGYINVDALRNYYKRELKGEISNSFYLWQSLILEKWARLNFDKLP